MKKLVLGLAVVAVIAMTSVPAIAATQWSFGGMMHYMTFWEQNNAGKNPVQMQDLQGGGATMKNDGRLLWGTQVNTRIMMWMESDTLDGFVEIGYDTNGNSVYPREYWGRYKFNDKASLIIGQQHQLYNSFISRQAGLEDTNLNGIGTAFCPPTPKIVFNYGGVGHMFFINSGFSLALEKPEAEGYYGWNSVVTSDIDAYFPQIQAAYSHYADTWRVKVAGAYQHTKWKKILAFNSRSKNIHSWLATVDGDISFGPLWLAANFTVGQNWGNAGMMNSEFGASYGHGNPDWYKSISSGQFDINGKWKNTTSAMASIVAAYQLTETLRFEIGAGYRYDDNKLFEKHSNLWAVYLQAAYTIAPSFEVVPEIGYVDRCQDAFTGKNDGYLWYVGAQWNMYF